MKYEIKVFMYEIVSTSYHLCTDVVSEIILTQTLDHIYADAHDIYFYCNIEAKTVHELFYNGNGNI